MKQAPGCEKHEQKRHPKKCSECRKIANRCYYSAHAEESRAYAHDYYKRNKKHCQERHRKWTKAHLAEKAVRSFQYRSNLRSKVLSFLGGKCEVCGFSDTRALQIDHVNGGGAKELSSLGYTAYLHKILRDKRGYQILCANHNWIKRHEKRERAVSKYY